MQKKCTALRFVSALLLFTLAAVFSNSGYAQVKNVLYGEQYVSDKLCIHFDKNGSVYPDFLIPDSLLEICEASLDTFYAKHPSYFKEIARHYNLTDSLCSVLSVSILHDSIRSAILKKITITFNEETPLTFIIHGFRKSYRNKEGVFTSVLDYQILEDALKGQNLSSGYVRIFWDGMYSDIRLNRKKIKAVLSTFVKSQVNAANAAVGLRKIITALPHQHLNLISHSLGAKVICSTLFDTTANTSPTPSQKKINICLVAPAIDADVFKNYFSRNSMVNYKKADNYRLLILYNEKDFVLRKRDNVIGLFGPGPRRYGKTTLGCNCRNDIQKLHLLFHEKFPSSVIQTVNMTALIGKCHHLRCYYYVDHLKEAVLFMQQ